jgi:hypothetical protein
VQAFATRNTLQDPPVLTTASPVIVAAGVDRRWLGGQVKVIANPQAPAAAPATATPRPVVVAAAADRRWFAVAPPARIARGAPASTPPPSGSAPKLLMAGII